MGGGNAQKTGDMHCFHTHYFSDEFYIIFSHVAAEACGEVECCQSK